MDLRYERRAWTLIYLCLGLVEGGTAAVMVRALFGDQVSTVAVDLVLAFVSSAPAWSNLASMQYAQRAQGQPKVAFLFPLLIAMTVCVSFSLGDIYGILKICTICFSLFLFN
jgi:hypothetical protein